LMIANRERMELGRRVLIAAPKVAETVEQFHRWAPEAAEAAQGAKFQPTMKDGRLVAIEGALGRFEVVQEFRREENGLFARIVFVEPPTRLHKDPREIYCIRIFEETAHFGSGPDPDHFDWDHGRNCWSPRNWLRIGYEIAAVVTEPRK